jgi:hypothetical protein
MWRRLLKRTHPDQGGDDALFVWTRLVQEAICGREVCEEDPPRRSSTPTEEQARVPFEKAQSFDDLTRHAVALADTVDAAFARLLRLLEDCEEEDEDSPLFTQQQLGATYKTLAAIGHAAGMNGAERAHWYKLAEQIPLSQRHAGHILTRLKKGEA